MCRSIQTLYNRQPPASEEEIQAAALQYVRKLSGYRKPSRANQAAFQAAVDAVTAATTVLLNSLETNAPPRPAGRARVFVGAQGNAQNPIIHSQPLRPAELDTGVE